MRMPVLDETWPRFAASRDSGCDPVVSLPKAPPSVAACRAKRSDPIFNRLRVRPFLLERPTALTIIPAKSTGSEQHMSSAKGNAVIGQSGGPTSVINQSLVGVVKEARKHGHIGRLLGARHGVRGIVNDDFIELNDAPDDLLERIAQTPAAALGSTRDKPDAAYCERIFDGFKKHDVRYFFYIGGNDSADTARIVRSWRRRTSTSCASSTSPRRSTTTCACTTTRPASAAAARFVASAIMGDDYDNASLPGIKVDVIMGRHAGFLTAASVLARQHPERRPAPDLRARGAAQRGEVPRRRRRRLQEARPLPHRRQRRRQPARRQDVGRGDAAKAASRRTRTATSSSPAPARSATTSPA